MARGPFIVFLGRQGAGKGTQCVRLARSFAIPHIATGDMLRGSVRLGTRLGLVAKSYMDRGELIPDHVVAEMVRERLQRDNAREQGFILDGYPRTINQAKDLEKILEPNSLDVVIDLEVPKEVVLKRLAARRVCVDCQAVYSTTMKPRVNWTCDNCGGEVIQRDDDKEESILRRLEIYDKETAPLIEYYSSQGILVKINGVGPTDAIFSRVFKAVNEMVAKK